MATQNVSEEQLQSQFTYIDAVARLLGDKRPKAYTHTFGCQQNEADTERIRGMLSVSMPRIVRSATSAHSAI